jgi:hypothetical protein
MAWIEIIRVSLAKGSQGVLKTLESQLASVLSLDWEMYQNPSVPEDILILLRWETDPAGQTESDIALSLVYELKRHGLVSHTVWINRCEAKPC